VFHVSLLERYWEGVEKADPPPDPEIVDGEEEYRVEAVLDHRTVRKGRGTREELWNVSLRARDILAANAGQAHRPSW
jgi:hypothetical protein